MGSGGTEWDVEDIVSIDRLNQKTRFVGTGAQIAALTGADRQPGMEVFCTTTGSGFFLNEAYQRNAANTAWENLGVELIWGDGSTGDATNPVSPTTGILHYNDLTFTSNTTWTMGDYSTLIINVRNLLSISTSITWTIIADSPNDAAGAPSPSTSTGGAGKGGCTVIILAKSISMGSGSIIDVQATAGAGGTGGTGTTQPGRMHGYDGSIGDAVVIGDIVLVGSQQIGRGGAIDNVSGVTRNTPAGIGVSIANPLRSLRRISDILKCHSSSGGGAGSGGVGVSTGVESASGGSGGAGGSTGFAAGGNGGTGGDPAGVASGEAGGGGGGGAACLFIFITETMSSNLTLKATGTNGGAGGNAGAASIGRGGGGGGGAASVVLVAASDVGTRTTTAGSGGAAGSGTGSGGAAGSSGGTSSTFIDISTIKRTL